MIKKIIRYIFLEKIGIKIISLIIAILLWALIQYNQFSSMMIEVPILYTNMSTSFVLKEKPQKKLEVIILSIKQQEKSTVSSKWNVFVDLHDASIERENYRTFIDKKLLPPNIKIVRYPKYVKVNLDMKVRKEIPLKLETNGTPMFGYFVKKHSNASRKNFNRRRKNKIR